MNSMWPVDKYNVMLQTGAVLVAKGFVCYCQSSSSLDCCCSSIAEASSLVPFCCIRFYSGLSLSRCLRVKSCAPSCSTTPEQDRKRTNEAYHDKAGTEQCALLTLLFYAVKVCLHVESALDNTHVSSSSSSSSSSLTAVVHKS